MSGFSIEDSNGTKITFESNSTTETFWKSHMIKDAILELIGSADLSKWDDDEKELSSDDFFKIIITELAQFWYYEDDFADEESTVKQQLLAMIEALELDRVTLKFDDDDEEEDF